jgi:hypothetical protein
LIHGANPSSPSTLAVVALLLVAPAQAASPDATSTPLEAPAPAAEPAAEPDAEPDAPPATPARRHKWGGMMIPLIGGNPIDGFGLGFGGEVYRRPADQAEGYDLKITPSLYFNTRLDYTNDYVRVEWQGEARWLVMVGYQLWNNLSYAGAGGAMVLVDHGDAELGNRVSTPYAFVGVNRPMGGVGWSLFGQAYVRGATVRPAPGGLLDRQRPQGVDGGAYTDVSLGVEHREHDRWPMPHRGHIFDVSLRAGGTARRGGFDPLAGAMLEAMAWRPLLGDGLIGGARVVVDKSSAPQPFFEQDKAAGRWRDELGSEQALAGYGRTRTRGDGLAAVLVELRPTLFRVDKGFFDLQAHLSFTAEIGWLYDRWNPGPPLPTVGFGVPLLWQQAVQLRPFLAWGWRAPAPGAPRRPGMQFGISVLDAL